METYRQFGTGFYYTLVGKNDDLGIVYLKDGAGITIVVSYISFTNNYTKVN